MSSLEKFYQFIERRVSLSDQDKQWIADILTEEKIEKGNVLVRAGEVCKTARFVDTGIYRVFKVKDGNEITTYFNYDARNPIVASFVSMLMGTPSVETVECIVSGEVLKMSYADWEGLYHKSHQLNTFGRIMAEFNYVLAMERIDALQYHTATDRYLSFLSLYPDLVNRIPHHYIATYLGITPESLSRIRKELAKG